MTASCRCRLRLHGSRLAALAALVVLTQPALGLTPPPGAWTPTRHQTVGPVRDGDSILALRVEGLGAERFLAVWHHMENAQPLSGLIVDAHGAAVGVPFPVTVAGRPVADLATAASPTGDVLVAWSEKRAGGPSRAVHFRRYGADGRALHAPLPVAAPNGEDQTYPAAAFRADGAALIVWYAGDEVRGRLFDRDGLPIGDERTYLVTLDPYRLSVVAIPESTGFLVMAAFDDTWRRLDSAGAPVGPVMFSGMQPLAVLVEVFAFTTSQFEVLMEDPEWSYTCPSGVGFCGEPFNVALADPFDLDATGLVRPQPLDDAAVSTPSAVRHGGSLLVAWPESEMPVSQWARAVPPGATPRLAHDSPGRVETGFVDVGANGRGDAIVAWLAAVIDDPYLSGRRLQLRLSVFQADTDLDGVVDAADLCPADFDPAQLDADGDRLGAACDCDDADPLNLTLCLGPAGRFAVRAEWRTTTSAAGPGRARPLTPDTGAFWFFAGDNLELMVKVLDGCVVNGHWWVFAGGLTDVATRIEVTDRLTGVRREWTSPVGSPFAPLQDTLAFACEPPPSS